MVKEKDDFHRRRAYQIEARCDIESLLGMLAIAYDKLNISGCNVEHWTGLAMESEALLSKWKSSDASRYEEQFKK